MLGNPAQAVKKVKQKQELFRVLSGDFSDEAFFTVMAFVPKGTQTVYLSSPEHVESKGERKLMMESIEIKLQKIALPLRFQVTIVDLSTGGASYKT